MEQRRQIIPDTFMEQRVQQANTSQTEQGICLHSKANMNPLFPGLRAHTRAGHWATTESGRLQRGAREEQVRIQRTFSKQNIDPRGFIFALK